MPVAVHAFIDEQVRTLEAEIVRGYAVASILAVVAVGIVVAAFMFHVSGPEVAGIPSPIYSKLFPAALSCFAAGGSYLPLKLIGPTQRRIAALQAAKQLPRADVLEMVKKAAEQAIAGK